MASITLLELHARERLSMSAGWYAHTFYAERNLADLRQTMYYRVSGCMAPLVTRGPRTGRPNFRKHEKGTERTVYILPQDQEAWEAAWEQRTGQCRACLGAGETVQRWSASDGNTMQSCTRCAGAGTPACELAQEGTP